MDGGQDFAVQSLEDNFLVLSERGLILIFSRRSAVVWSRGCMHPIQLQQSTVFSVAIVKTSHRSNNGDRWQYKDKQHLGVNEELEN